MDALTPTPRLKIFGAQAQLHCVAPGSSNGGNLRPFRTTHHPAGTDFTNQNKLVPGWLLPG